MKSMKNKLFYINRFLGRSIQFRNGFSIGFNWVHGNGETTKTSAILMSYNPPQSITWRWAFYWSKPARLFHFSVYRRREMYGSLSIVLPLIGGFRLSWQPYTWKNRQAA